MALTTRLLTHVYKNEIEIESSPLDVEELLAIPELTSTEILETIEIRRTADPMLFEDLEYTCPICRQEYKSPPMAAWWGGMGRVVKKLKRACGIIQDEHTAPDHEVFVWTGLFEV